jgi:hypothetical protein
MRGCARSFSPLRLLLSLAGAAEIPAIATEARAQEQPASPAIVPPRLLSEANVPYPEGATGDASVVLTLVVLPDGRVGSASPTEELLPFSTHAAQHALGFVFAPATREGKPIAARIRFELVFRDPLPKLNETPVGETPAAPDPAPTADAAAPPVATRASETQTPAREATEREREAVEVVVEGDRPEPSRSATLSRAEVRQIPGTFGDPFRAIETLPGVTPIVSGLPFFFVRGAPPGNVGYFLDGVRVPLLFHVGAGPSVVHPALIERVDLYPGGYPARYGRFAGGVVAGETAPPSGELHGEYNLRVFDVGALAEAPFDGGRGVALLGGRYSYTAALLSLVNPETSLDYWDYQARLHYDLGENDSVQLFGFGSYDYVGQETATQRLTLFETEFHRVDLRHDHRIGPGRRLRSAFTLGLDQSQVQVDRTVTARLAAARNELDYRLSDVATLRAGTDLELNHFEIDQGIDNFSPAAARVFQLFETRTDVAIGARADFVLRVDPRLEITPGVRVDLFGSRGESVLAVDPRLGLRTTVSDRVTLLTALGLAHQPPAFVVPVPGIRPDLSGGLQQSVQESFGVEVELEEGTLATASVFHNGFFDMSDPLGAAEVLVQGCPPGAYPSETLGGDPGARLEQPPFCGDRFDDGEIGPDRSGGAGQAADSRGGRRFADAFLVRTQGRAYGFELYLKRRMTGKLGGFLSYTLSRSTRSFGRRSYIASFDRTHVLNAALAYSLGRNWRAGARAMFYTGLPKLPVPGDPSTRLPPFFRFDVRLEKRWQLGETTHISFVAEWLNATLSKEAVTTRCTLSGCEAQRIGPVTIPSLGVEGGF